MFGVFLWWNTTVLMLYKHVCQGSIAAAQPSAARARYIDDLNDLKCWFFAVSLSRNVRVCFLGVLQIQIESLTLTLFTQTKKKKTFTRPEDMRALAYVSLSLSHTISILYNVLIISFFFRAHFLGGWLYISPVNSLFFLDSFLFSAFQFIHNTKTAVHSCICSMRRRKTKKDKSRDCFVID